MDITIPDHLLNLVFDQTRAAVTIADSNGRTTMFNQAAEALTGYRREEVLGRHISMFYRSADDLASLWSELETNDYIDSRDVVLVSKEDRSIPVTITITALRDADRKLVGTAGITQLRSSTGPEPTANARARAELFNAILCHDINNYMQIIQGYMELMNTGAVGHVSEGQRRFLAVCQRQILRVRDLISRVQTLSEVEESTSLDVESTPLGPALDEAIERARDVLSGNQPTIHYTPTAVGEVLASPLLLDVLYNLLSNSILHNSSASPTVWVRVERTSRAERPYWLVTIDDDGPGIPNHRRQELEREETLQTTAVSGMGLKLARTIVKRFGGSLELQERVPGDPGSGTRAAVLLLESSRVKH